MKEVLAGYHLKLPKCELSDEHFAENGGILEGERLWVHFKASPECVQKFLVSVFGTDKEVVEHLVILSGEGVPFSEAKERYGWSFDGMTEYRRYQASSRGFTTEIVVDDSAAIWSVFVYAIENGW